MLGGISLLVNIKFHKTFWGKVFKARRGGIKKLKSNRFNKYRDRFKNIFWKNFLSYILVLLIPLTSLGILSYCLTQRLLTKEVKQSYDVIIKELDTSINQNIKEINYMATQLSYLQWVKKAMYMRGTPFDYNLLNGIELSNNVGELKGFDAINDFIDTVILYFPKLEFVITSRGADNAEVFYNEVFKLDNMNYEKWKNTLNGWYSSKIIGARTLNHYGIKNRVITYVQPIMSYDLKPHAYFVTFIKENDILEKLRTLQLSKQSSIYIFDDKNNKITGLNEDGQFLSNINKYGILDKPKVDNIIEIDGKNYFVFNRKSTFNSWYYVITVPNSVVMKKVNDLRFLNFLIVILLAVIGLYTSYILAKKNYMPVLNLVNLFHTKETYKLNPQDNEYDFLKNSINDLFNNDDILKKQNEQQKPFLRNTYFLQLLKGAFNNMNVSEEILRALDINLDKSEFFTLVFTLNIVCGIGTEFQKKSEDLIKLYKGNIFWAEITGKKKAAVFNLSDIESIKEIIFKVKELFEVELDTKCTVGVGRKYKSINGIATSYNEASSAAEYKIIDGVGEVIFFDEINTSNTEIYYYPVEKELEIMGLLRRGKYEETQGAIEVVISKNFSNDNLSNNNGKYLCYDIMGTIFKVLNDLKLKDIISEMHEKDFNNMETLSEMQQFLIKLCERICSTIDLTQNKNNHYDILKLNMLKYVDENFHRPDLSLETLAEAMNRSSSFMSRFFKEQLGYNFLDYLNRKRIVKSKELLNGQMTIIQISNLVGFNSDMTFRRVFRKYEGIAPGEYSISKE